MNLKNRRNGFAIPDDAVPLADEAFFKRMLLLERRRCERSGTRFALMLIDLEELRRTLGTPEIEDLGRAIGGSMRETDITGWHRQSSVIGVVIPRRGVERNGAFHC